MATTTNLWGGIPSIDELVLHADTSQMPVPGEIVPCLMCAKPLLVRPYIGVPDQICPNCMDTYNECAKLVCQRCGVVVARVKPGVTDSGFKIRKRAILHIDYCNVCFQGETLRYSTVIEIDQWEKATGRQNKLYIPVGFQKKEDS